MEEYRHAARCALKAGFDGVEIHCANGYFLDNCVQTCSNQRTDAYGGSAENRLRLVLEVIDVVKEVFPINRIAIRVSPNGVFNSMGSTDNIETFSYMLSHLNDNMAYLHIMDGLAFGYHEKCPVFTLDMARAHFKGTIMANCGYDKDSAEAAVSGGKADMVAFGRSYIANPDLPARFANDWPLAVAKNDIFYVYPGFPEGNPNIGYTDFPVYTPPSV